MAKLTQRIREQLTNCGDVTERTVAMGPPLQQTATLFYTQTLIDSQVLQDGILTPLQVGDEGCPPTFAEVAQRLLGASFEYAQQPDQIVEEILRGRVAVIPEGATTAALVDAAKPIGRQPQQATLERAVRGPQEAMVENLQVNLGLIRQRLPSADLKIEYFYLGRRSRTQTALLYIESIINPKLVTEIKERLGRIDIDAILDSGELEEFIEDQTFTLFPQIQHTERPDKVSADLLSGRFALLVNGSPLALLAPTTLWHYLQSTDDFHERWLPASILRLQRILSLGLSLFLPAFYVALNTYHHELLPTSLYVLLAAQRDGNPFPALLEAFLMEAVFEIVREAGIRIPGPVGQTVSFVGAIVIGQAAIQAGLASASTVMVVSLTAIANFTIPGYDLALALRILRFILLLSAGVLGLYGVTLVGISVLVHLLGLRSFGTPYLAPVSPLAWPDAAQMLLRTPWWSRRLRPQMLRPADLVRHRQNQQSSNQRQGGDPPET